MPLLARGTTRLLRQVGGKEHATDEHHQKDGHGAIEGTPESSDDDDNDKAIFGTLPNARRMKRIRPPQRTANEVADSASPAKRREGFEDEVEKNIFSASQSSQSKRLKKTFSRKTVLSATSRSKPAAPSFKHPKPLPEVQKPPDTKKGFQNPPGQGLTSSQPEKSSSSVTAPVFRQPIGHIKSSSVLPESTEESFNLPSSQLFDPSSPLTSLNDSDPDEPSDLDLDLIGKFICPICGDKVETEFKDKFQNEVCSGRRMNLRMQERFCKAHKSRNANQIWSDRGYPQIDWSTLRERLEAHHDHLQAVLDGTFDSPYRKDHRKLLATRDGDTALHAISTGVNTLRAGYYGTKGEKLMAEHIVRVFASELRNLSGSDKLMARSGSSGGVSGYVHAVLVPELAVGLIMEDMECDRQAAMRIMADSVDVGEALNEEENDAVPHVEIDLLDPGKSEDEGGGGLGSFREQTLELD